MLKVVLGGTAFLAFHTYVLRPAAAFHFLEAGRPSGERRDESRLYVAEFTCVRRGMLPRGWRPRRGQTISNLGWSAAEPEVAGWRECRPRRGRYASGGV